MGIPDGIFWLDKEEFFTYFTTIYLCAKDMSAWTNPSRAVRGNRVAKEKKAAK